ncbi:glycosyltransferase family 20-domain-containing protein [Phellopilus nigrolimitatus]|nr:glycosyltransferase family 20-domain-containing protein [Phellopilus nigrolimitatus]
MSAFRSRVVIASLFLPDTVSLGEGSEASTPTKAVAEPGPSGASVAAHRLLSGIASPHPKTPAFSRTSSSVPRSIVEDLTDKSRGPSVTVTPAREAANPFFSLPSSPNPNTLSNPLAAAVHALVGTPGTEGAPPPPRRSPGTADRLQPRVSRKGSRSTSRRPDLEHTKWHSEPNPHCNGGLRNAVASVRDRLRRKLWIGVLGTPTDTFDKDLRRDINNRMRLENNSVPVWIPDAEFSKCYDEFCHQVLWPCLHYAIPDAPKTKSFYDSESWDQYCAVNQKFADAIVANYEEGDIIWVNDYHLMLLPSMLRAKLPNAPIGFFMHVAFPSSEIFRCLSVREQLLQGMLAADLLGFQTASFARHFRQTVSRILSFEALPKGIQTPQRFVDVAVFPMGIDVKSLTLKRREPEVAEWAQHLRDRYAGLKMIVGRDKLDGIAGMRHKIRAFEIFLEKYPEFQGKVVLIQVALSTTEENELQGSVIDLVGRINSKFSTLTYQPIVFLHTDDLTFTQYLALLTVADAFLVTSLREGMALRTHEFVECQEARARPLILSEFTGSYSYSGFRACLPVNPWDTRMTAQAIHTALTMGDEEARSRWRDLHAHHEKAAEGDAVGRAPSLDVSLLLPRYRHARKRLILVDFEGTLWLRDPRSRAFDPPHEALDVLKALAEDERNDVWLLSGLPIGGNLDKVARDLPDVGLCAENGCFIKPRAVAGTPQPWINTVANFNLSWKAPCLEMLQYFSERTPGSFVEEREASIVWRFWTNQSESAADRQWAMRQAAEAQNHIFDSLGEKYGLRIIPGANSFLVLPNNVSRSSAVGAILAPGGPARSPVAATPRALWMGMALDADAGLETDLDFVLALGKDEKLLRRLNELECAETASCAGSGVGTDAKWRVEPGEAVVVLRQFTQAT